ncbi:uncharacterized [Tachysurus ichikawai]
MSLWLLTPSRVTRRDNVMLISPLHPQQPRDDTLAQAWLYWKLASCPEREYESGTFLRREKGWIGLQQAVRLALASSPETFSPALKLLLGKRRVFDFSVRALKKEPNTWQNVA